MNFYSNKILYCSCSSIEKCIGSFNTLTIEHVVPKSVLKKHKVDVNIPYNLLPCCMYMNRLKSNLPLGTFIPENDEGKGLLARITLNMYQKYLPIEVPHYKLLLHWSLKYKPSSFELWRDQQYFK